MSNYTRRDMLKILSAAGLVSSGFGMSRAAFGASAAHIVIVGGGIGGIATAKYLRIINDQVKITVIEPSSKYTFCPGSNEVLTGKPISDFERSYDHTMKRYNFNMVASKVEDIDFNGKVVKTAAGDTIKYDTLVISTGPDFIFDNIEGYSKELAETRILHAWKAGIQTTMLRDQIAAMPDGGTIRVQIRDETPESLTLSVEDTGQGIPPEIARSLFDPFFSTKEGGVGLGLSIVARLLEACGGGIRLDGGYGPGARFLVTLPTAHPLSRH